MKNLLKFFIEHINDIDIFLEFLQKEISLPNIPSKTFGGKTFWNTICEYNGWKLQQNMITHHARILDQHNVRIAWGTLNGMEKALNNFKKRLAK